MPPLASNSCPPSACSHSFLVTNRVLVARRWPNTRRPDRPGPGIYTCRWHGLCITFTSLHSFVLASSSLFVLTPPGCLFDAFRPLRLSQHAPLHHHPLSHSAPHQSMFLMHSTHTYHSHIHHMLNSPLYSITTSHNTHSTVHRPPLTSFPSPTVRYSILLQALHLFAASDRRRRGARRMLDGIRCRTRCMACDRSIG